MRFYSRLHKGAVKDRGEREREKEVCLWHLPMFTWTFFIHGYTTGSLRVLVGDEVLWL